MDALVAGSGSAHTELGSVALWFLDVARAEPTDVSSVLDEREATTAQRFHFLDDRRTYTEGHALLRRVLGAWTDLAPAALVFDRRCLRCGHPDHGKPRLAGPDMPEFSLSHSGSLVLVAVATTMVGVDVEVTAGRSISDAVLRRCCTPAEQAWLAARPVSERRSGFLHLWARKEAAAKAVGIGTATNLAKLDVLAGDPCASRVPGDDRPVTVHSLDIAGARAAVATAPT